MSFREDGAAALDWCARYLVLRDLDAGFRPEHIDVGNGRPDGLDFDARVEVVEYLGDEQLVHLTRRDTAIQAKVPIEEQVSAGQELKLTVPRDKLLLFDAATEERISG